MRAHEIFRIYYSSMDRVSRNGSRGWHHPTSLSCPEELFLPLRIISGETLNGVHFALVLPSYERRRRRRRHGVFSRSFSMASGRCDKGHALARTTNRYLLYPLSMSVCGVLLAPCSPRDFQLLLKTCLSKERREERDGGKGRCQLYRGN